MLGAALAVFGYSMFFNTLAPLPTDLQTARGSIASAEANSRKGSIHTIVFTIDGRSEHFAYPGIQRDINGAWSRMKIGADAVVVFNDDDLSSQLVDVWGLELDGRQLIEPGQALDDRRTNGRWGLALGVISTFCAGYMWLGLRRGRRPR
ncbi:MAG: hypothetical protein HOQ01_00655 [Lysobacter sp.]|nr:hypothetical protein [Lysobacter sp.]